MGGAWDHGGGEKGSYAETAWMFKLRRELDQLDSIHHQTEHGVVKARSGLASDCFRPPLHKHTVHIYLV